MKTLLRFPYLWQSAIVALSLSAADVGRANPPKPQPATPDEGTTFWLRGDAAVKADHYTEAVEEWTKAWKHRPNNHRLACKIGRAEHRRANDIGTATWLKRCLLLRPKGTTPEEIEIAKEITLEYETAVQRISTVTLDSDEPDTRIVINDEIVQKTPVLEDVYLEPGKQEFYAYNGLRSMSMTLSTVAGKAYRVAVSLPPRVQSVAFTPVSKIPAVIDDGIDWSKHPIPPPRYFRWWPVGLGGALAGTGLITGSLLSIKADIASGDAMSTLNSIQSDGKSCGTPAADPRCASYQELADKSNALSTAAIGTFIATGAITGFVIGYIIYENHRLSVAPTVSGAVGRYQW